jgi:C1A family cysteine protease
LNQGTNMKFFFGIIVTVLMATLLIRCSGNSAIPNPVKPIVPNPIAKPLHGRGFKKLTTHGLVLGAPFILADIHPSLAVSFSWYNDYSMPIHDQGQCGGCWSFATATSAEYGGNIFLNQKLQLSEQFMIGRDFYGCDGGDFDGATVVNPGLPSAADCPFTGDDSQCPSGLAIALKGLSVYNVGDGTNALTEVQIKEALIEYGPLAVDADATGWDSNSGEIITGNGGSIDHMITLLGWDDTKSAWQFQNSWGTSWGNGGIGLIAYGADSFATDAAVTILKQVDTHERN